MEGLYKKTFLKKDHPKHLGQGKDVYRHCRWEYVH